MSSKILVGDIVFISGTSWISNVIKVVSTGLAKYDKKFDFVPSHIGVVRDVISDQHLIIEVVFNGKRSHWTIQNYIDTKSKVIIKRIKNNTSHYDIFKIKKAIENLENMKVISYDWGLILSYLIRYAIRKIWHYKNSVGFSWLLQKKVAFVCSEFVNEGYLKFREIYIDEIYPTPHDLFRKLDCDIIYKNV